MTKHFFFSLITIILFTGVDCKKEPPVVPPPPKDMRNLTWTVDTLAYPGSMQTSMRRMWASSAKDVYVVGHNDQNRGQMYHYDGISWKSIKLASSEGGQIIGPTDLSDIYGFATNGVYAVGQKIYQNFSPPPNFFDSSLIIYYDGVQWKEESLFRKKNLATIWGSSVSDAWAGGSYGSLFHRKGSKWQLVPLDSTLSVSSICGLSSNDVYFAMVKEDSVMPNDTLTYQMWHYNGTTLLVIDSFTVTPSNLSWKFGYYLWQTENTLYSSGYGVFKRNGITWEKILESEYPLRICGNSNKNIFAVGDRGRIFHWNGSDWKRLTEIENPMVQFVGVWTDGEEVFIVGSDGYKSYILHGK